MIKDNLSLVKEKITSVCDRLGVDSKSITLVGVTKYAELEDIKSAIAAGLTDIGENKVQEAQRKFVNLDQDSPKVTRHMIGHLQTNKVKQAIELFDLIQSVDSFKLAQEIETQAQKQDRQINILIQVNTSGETQKFGVSEAETRPLLEKISEFKHVHVKGLMTMAPHLDDRDVIRDCFVKLRLLKERIVDEAANFKNVEMQYLSMGMTHDFDIAIEEGSNMVRVGRAIFQG